jgi:hypothetical protein
METLQFEAVKVALKQDKTGYVLTLCLHPDDIPESLLRDFVGSRYQVVMVRLNDVDMPLDRQGSFGGDRSIKIAGSMCRDKIFHSFLFDDLRIIHADEKEATEWLRGYLNIASRSELKTNTNAQKALEDLHKEFLEWKQKKWFPTQSTSQGNITEG